MTFKELTTSEGIKSLSVLLSIVGTIYGVIHFGVVKIAAYDGYEDRLARIEAKQIELAQVFDNDKIEQLTLKAQGDDIDAMKRRVETDSQTLVDIRIQIEHLRGLVGDVRR